MSLHRAMTKVRASEEYYLLLKVVAAATDVVNEGISPSFRSMSKLADAVHAHLKFQAGDE